jgi:hypothetical protein
MFIWTFLLRITHTIISQSIEDSSWIILYMFIFWCMYGAWCKALPLQAWTALRVPEVWGSHTARQSSHEGDKVVSNTYRPPLLILVIISVRGWFKLQGHSAAGRFMLMKNSNETIGNRTRDLPACSKVPKPTVPPHARFSKKKKFFFYLGICVLIF